MTKTLNKIKYKLQDYTKTDVSYLAKGSFWLVINYAIQISIGILTTIALANLLPKETLGTYQYIMSIAGILSVLTLSGLGTAVTRSVAQGESGVLISSVRLKLKWCLTIVASSGLVALYYFINGNNLLATCFLIVGTLAPFIESFKLYENFLHGKKAFKDSVVLGIWRKPIPFIALILTLALTSNIIIIILSYFLSNAISYLLVYLATIKKYPEPITTTKIYHIAKHQSVFRIIGVIATNFDKVILWITLGSVAVATFSIAQLATKYSGLFMNTIATLTLPKVANRELTTLQITLPRKVFLLFFLTLIFTAFYIICAPLFFKIFFPTYPESILITQVLAINFLFIPRAVFGQVLIAHHQTKYQYILSLSTAFIKILLFIVLIPQFGIWGAVYAILATNLIGYVLTYTFFKWAKTLEQN